jgi:2-polyprenyl-6-hydroxyphenyl methylase / 3-demethylubiquinone-9 3-methyltransferase
LTTIDKKEIEKFSKLAKDWWNPNGKFKPLHLFNPIRIKFIKEKIISYFKLNPNSNEPLSSLNILDIGCGGGLLCEPLKRLGASITGIDASSDNIEVAKLHAKKMNLNINYFQCSPEKLNFEKKYDVILNMEVVEHVSDVDFFIQNCSKLTKKNGLMFVATLNKNLKSYLFAIVGAEYILKWLPIGTHDWNRFLTPQELENIANKQGFLNNEVAGMKFNLFTKTWDTSEDVSVNYISTFLKS